MCARSSIREISYPKCFNKLSSHPQPMFCGTYVVSPSSAVSVALRAMRVTSCHNLHLERKEAEESLGDALGISSRFEHHFLGLIFDFSFTEFLQQQSQEKPAYLTMVYSFHQLQIRTKQDKALLEKIYQSWIKNNKQRSTRE